MLVAIERPYSDEFVDAARRFYLDILTSDDASEPIVLSERVKQYFPDVIDSSPDVVRDRLRILGADFFRIVGVKQPTRAVTYEKVMNEFIEDEKARQALLDESA